jgi:hypothetical protein
MHHLRSPNAGHGIRPRNLALVVLFAFPLTLSCMIGERVSWLFLQAASRFGAMLPSSAYQAVEMTAQGHFDLQSQEGWTITSDLITLHWKVSPATGSVNPEVTGEGHRNTISPDGGTWGNQNFEFNGTVTPDGEQFAGVVHVTGRHQPLPGTVETLDYPASWTARRFGDTIIGTIDGMGPFHLTVETLPAE